MNLSAQNITNNTLSQQPYKISIKPSILYLQIQYYVKMDLIDIYLLNKHYNYYSIYYILESKSQDIEPSNHSDFLYEIFSNSIQQHSKIQYPFFYPYNKSSHGEAHPSLQYL